MHFGVTSREIFREWTYWQFEAYLRAAGDLLNPEEKPSEDGKVTTADGRKVVDGRNASAAQLRALGIPIEGG